MSAIARPAGAGVSPLGSGVGELSDLARYERTRREYGPLARRQLVCALQVHVAVPGSERALAVYNAARPYLPWLAALAANGPFYEGTDTGLASVRPKLSQLLPKRQNGGVHVAGRSRRQALPVSAFGRDSARGRRRQCGVQLHQRFTL